MNEEEREQKTMETANLRGQAKAFTLMGTAGVLGWAALELLPHWEGPVSVVADKGLKTGHKIAILAGFVGIGAAVFALERHLRANKIEDEQKLQSASLPGTSWVSRVGGESRESLQHLSGNSR